MKPEGTHYPIDSTRLKDEFPSKIEGCAPEAILTVARVIPVISSYKY